MRATMKMPAVTIVAAWISAEIGVGPSIESGSQTCSGTCALLPIAPTNRQMQMTLASDHTTPPPRSSVAVASSGARSNTVGVVERPGGGEHEADAEQEAEVADAVREERLQVRVDGRRPLVPEADQQVGHEADRLPPEEQLQEVVAHDEHEHREGEQRDVAEEPRVAGVVGHVADRVDVHHQRDEGHDRHHRRGQRVDQEADRERAGRRTRARCRRRR